MATAERIRSNPMESRGFSDNEQMDTAHITHQMGSTQMSSQQDSGFQNTLFQGQGSTIEQNMGSQTQGQSDFKRSRRQNQERGGTTFSMTETVRRTRQVVKEKNPSRSEKSNSGTQDFEDDKTDYDELSSEKRKNKVMKMIKNSHIEKIKNYIFLKEIDHAYDEMIRLRASGDIASSKEMERELNSLTQTIIQSNLDAFNKTQMAKTHAQQRRSGGPFSQFYDSKQSRTQKDIRRSQEERMYQTVTTTKRVVNRHSEDNDEEENQYEEEEKSEKKKGQKKKNKTKSDNNMKKRKNKSNTKIQNNNNQFDNNPNNQFGYNPNNPNSQYSYNPNYPNSQYSYNPNNPNSQYSYNPNNPNSQYSYNPNNPNSQYSYNPNNPNNQYGYNPNNNDPNYNPNIIPNNNNQGYNDPNNNFPNNQNPMQSQNFSNIHQDIQSITRDQRMNSSDSKKKDRFANLFDSQGSLGNSKFGENQVRKDPIEIMIH